MPYHIVEEHDECPADKPVGLVKDDDGKLMGCHPSMDAAQKQMSALHASERHNTVMDDVEVRHSTMTGVDTKLRLIDLVAVPWEQETEVMWRGEMWNEVFTRGAFDGIEDHAGRIRVNREHVRGDTVGKVVHLQNSDDGLLARVKIAETARGDETLALADEDMISPSVGFRIKSPSDVQLNKRIKMRRVLRAFLDHLAMVEAPAYGGAKVLAVRAEPSGLSVVEQKPLPATPALDEVLNDDVFLWVASRLSR